MSSISYLAVAKTRICVCVLVFLFFCHIEVQCDVRRPAFSSGGALVCVWLSGSHLFLHQQETLQRTQTSTAESSTEDGSASNPREVRPNDITLKAIF